MEVFIILDYGYRSKCCLAPIRVGHKKIRKTGQIIQVWICCSCETKDVKLVTRADAELFKKKDFLKPDIDDDKGFSE